MVAWWLLDGCLILAWFLLDASLMLAWCSLDACFMLSWCSLDARLMLPWCLLDTAGAYGAQEHWVVPFTPWIFKSNHWVIIIVILRHCPSKMSIRTLKIANNQTTRIKSCVRVALLSFSCCGGWPYFRSQVPLTSARYGSDWQSLTNAVKGPIDSVTIFYSNSVRIGSCWWYKP